MKAILLINAAKGAAMGAANVVPGVSGGTIALVTGIYERLILALKQIDAGLVRLLLQGQWRTLWERVDGTFLASVGLGMILGILGLARILEWLLMHHERLTFGFFFGLIAVSIYSVGREVKPWSAARMTALLGGAVIAVAIATRVPAEENANPLYLFLCGIVAICSMILPGLSGSFVLILMGNYALVLRALNQLELAHLIPIALGCGFGLLGFAQVVGWFFKRHPQGTLAVMTGFILGSLLTIWPWKEPRIRILHAEPVPREVLVGYQPYLPSINSPETWLTLTAIACGAALMIGAEYAARRRQTR